jgi:hypothetical protein
LPNGGGSAFAVAFERPTHFALIFAVPVAVAVALALAVSVAVAVALAWLWPLPLLLLLGKPRLQRVLKKARFLLARVKLAQV